MGNKSYKIAAVLTAIAVCAFSLCACSSVSDIVSEPVDSGPVDFSRLPEPATEWTVTDGITMRLSQTEYPPGVSQMTIIMENRSDFVMLYGQGWSFYKWLDGNWIKLENWPNSAFTAEGHLLSDHFKTTFDISTSILSKKLGEGLYRVVGIPFRVAADADELGYGGNYEDTPPYQLEFIVKKGAVSKAVETPVAKDGELRSKEDWEWYTWWEAATFYQNNRRYVWSNRSSSDGLVSLVWAEVSIEDGLHPGDILTVDLFDRRTGETYSALQFTAEEGYGADCAQPSEDGGFIIVIPEGTYHAGRRDGVWFCDKLD